ncbi:M16 family metallopeptidase [Microbulbifer taiwanensis]|uniref:M16 family metallopeptidase n=1 Tax=Microbulbifer taiwanensis TaxID=986746 RepID=UPI0036706366
MRQVLICLFLSTFFLASCGQPDEESHRALSVDKEAAASSRAAAADKQAYVAAPKLEIPFHKEVLDNGLTVIVHGDHKAPVVSINIWYKVGSKDEVPGKTGFAHLFEHLMFNGSENYPGEYFEPFQRSGATDMNGTTNNDRTNYFETVPKGALDMALWMESDRMGHFSGAITQEVLDEQRGVVKNEKRQGRMPLTVRPSIPSPSAPSPIPPLFVDADRFHGGPGQRQPGRCEKVVCGLLPAG